MPTEIIENEAATKAHSRRKKTDKIHKPLVLPQWAIDFIVRPVLGGFSRRAWQMTFHGIENIPNESDGGIIIAANHQTYIDPFWISIKVKRPTRYLAWNEAFEWKMTGRLMHLFGALPVQLEGGDRAAMTRSLAWLGGGGALMIFPEGGRGNTDGTLMRFKTGAARFAMEARVPILPVTIRGGHRAWNRTQKIPHIAPVSITYHPLQHITQHAGEDERAAARRATDELAQTIASAL